MGQRFESLDALEKAAKIGRELGLPPEDFESLRDEAIACLALPDLEQVGRVIRRPPKLNGGLYALDPVRPRYALRFRDGTVSVRDADDDHELASFQARGDQEIHFNFSPDGHYLATTQQPGYGLKVWDIDRRTVALDDPGPVSWGHSARFTPDSRRLVLARDDGKLIVYDLATGQIAHQWRGPGQAQDLAIRGDGGRIAILYKEKIPTCRIIEAETGRLVRSIPLPDIADWVAWSPDGNTLATCQDRKIYLWDTETGIRTATLEGHTYPGLAAVFHPAGTVLASNGWEGRLWIWDTVLGRPWLSVIGHTDVLAFSPDGRIAVSRAEKLITFRVDPAREYRTLAPLPDRSAWYEDVAIRRDGRVAALGTNRGAVVFDLAHGARLAFLVIGTVLLMFEESGDLLTTGASGSWRWTIRLDPERKDFRIGPPQRLRLPGGPEDFAADRTGRTLAIAADDRAYVQTPDRTITLSPLDGVRGIAVSPDGAWVVTGSHGRNGFQVWRSRDGARVADRDIEGLVRVRFSPDGR
jgi:WD40 repeat protein